MNRTLFCCLLALPAASCGANQVDTAPQAPTAVYDSTPTSLAEQPPGLLISASLFFANPEPADDLILTVESLGFIFDLDADGAHIRIGEAFSGLVEPAAIDGIEELDEVLDVRPFLGPDEPSTLIFE